MQRGFITRWPGFLIYERKMTLARLVLSNIEEPCTRQERNPYASVAAEGGG
jgi:hypothetical protein